MHCRVFDIRLGTHCDADQATLNAFLDQVDVVSTTATLINTSTQFWSVLVFFEELSRMKREERSAVAPEMQADNNPKHKEPSTQSELDPAHQQIYDKLRHWRSTQAQTEGVPVYVVAHNSMLQQIAQRGVRSREELLDIARFGPKRVEKYGDAIMDVLADAAGL